MVVRGFLDEEFHCSRESTWRDIFVGQYFLIGLSKYIDFQGTALYNNPVNFHLFAM